MNRTRKLVAAGIGTAVIVVIIAMILMNPTLHTQTPTGSNPPSNGGTGGGSGSGTGTGGGSGSTASNCTATGDDGNVTDQSLVVHTSDGNETNETGDTDGGACNASGVDHDSMGDQMSHDHNGHEDGGLAGALSADVLVLAQSVGAWALAGVGAIVSLAKSLAGTLAGLASYGVFIVAGR